MLDLLAGHPYLKQLVMSSLAGIGVYVACAIVVLVAELSQRSDMSVYRTRSALNDLAYGIFYQCSIYNLVAAPLFSLLAPRLQFLRIGLLSDLPPLPSLVVSWLIFDFLNYWVHRAQHSMRPLWAFHSVHHAQTELTFLSSNRIHVFEQLYVGMLMMVPGFLLGSAQPRWLPILFLQLFFETIQHSRLNWSFGPLRRVVVSPLLHRFHHSADEREYNGNFGRVFSLWDVIFGTYVHADTNAPERQGVDGMVIAETLTAQFFHPVRYLAGVWFGGAKGTRAVTAEPQSDPA